MGDRSCFMVLPGGAPVAGDGGGGGPAKPASGGGNKGSNYCAKELKEEWAFGGNYGGGSGGGSKPSNANPGPDPGEKSCFMGVFK